jgi:hypothetical protein
MNTMENSCPDVGVLAGWLEGSLSPEDRSRMSSHLAACDECRRSVALASTLDAAPSEAPVNEILLSKVVSASRRRRFLPFATAAAAVLAVAVGLSLYNRNPAPAPRPVAVDKTPIEHVAVRPDPLPADPTTPKPAPVLPQPEVPKNPPVVETPKVDPKPEIVEKPVVPPTPVPDPVPTVPKPVVVEKPVETPVADLKGYSPVFVLDPIGDLWLRRGAAEAKAGSFEKAAWKDFFAARAGGAAFSLEARTSVMLEKGSEAAFSHLKTDDTYSLALEQGLVMLDTEGSTQKWQISFGKNKLSFSDLNGRLAVESRGDRLSALLLAGSAELKINDQAKKATVGQEVILSRESTQVDEQKGETQKRLARLDELRPKVFTAFNATFDEKREEFQPYPYAVVAGKLSLGQGSFFLQSEAIPAVKGVEKGALAAELHLDRPFGVMSGMVVKFRYRTTLPAFSVKIGKYSADYTSKAKAGQWGEAEILLKEFSFEGTPMLPSDPVENVRFSGLLDKRSSQLDIDGVQFLRRVR